MSTETTTIPYGPDHRRDLAAFCGLEDIDLYHGSKNRLRLLDRECICGITLESFLLPDGRVLVTRQDRYTCHTQATLFPGREPWNQWWYHDRRKGEIDPETGRPFAHRAS